MRSCIFYKSHLFYQAVFLPLIILTSLYQTVFFSIYHFFFLSGRSLQEQQLAHHPLYWRQRGLLLHIVRLFAWNTGWEKKTFSKPWNWSVWEKLCRVPISPWDGCLVGQLPCMDNCLRASSFRLSGSWHQIIQSFEFLARWVLPCSIYLLVEEERPIFIEQVLRHYFFISEFEAYKKRVCENYFSKNIIDISLSW